MKKLTERHCQILTRGAEAMAYRGTYKWLSADLPATREVNALLRRGLMSMSEYSTGRAAANATEAGRKALADMATSAASSRT